MAHDVTPPESGAADVRITAASPEVAGHGAHAPRARFAGTGQRGRPDEGRGMSAALPLTVGTARYPRSGPPQESAPDGIRREGTRRIWP
jgi:hypothetical protein